MSSLKIALCQIEVRASEREGNFARIAEALSQAARQGTELAVFPESAILGWINPQAHELATPIPGADTVRLCEMARLNGIGIVIGIDEKVGDQLHGSAVAISPMGELLAVHRKSNVLTELMDPPYTPGEAGAVTIADFPFGRVAILICADSFVPETISRVRSLKPDLVTIPYGWVAESQSWPQHGQQLRDLVCDLATKFGVPVIGVDGVGSVPAGPWKDRHFCGASTAAHADGKPLAFAEFSRPSTTVVSVSV